MERKLKMLFLASGFLALVLTVGFYRQISLATDLWMWADGRLTYIFIASITAAIAVPIIWMGLTGEWGAAVGGAVNLSIQAGGIALFLTQTSLNSDSTYWGHVLVVTMFAAINVGVFFWSRHYSFRDTRRTPFLVRASFGVFTLILLIVAFALLLKTPNVFPWTLQPATSVIIGWVFMGTVVYFLYACLVPYWGNAIGQLLGFLAYDLILIVPFIEHFAQVLPAQRLSLMIYTGVLVYSGVLAIYFLFIHPPTRFQKSVLG